MANRHTRIIDALSRYCSAYRVHGVRQDHASEIGLEMGQGLGNIEKVLTAMPRVGFKDGMAERIDAITARASDEAKTDPVSSWRRPQYANA